MPIRFAAALVGALALAVPLAANAQDAARGKELYETRCVGCHSKSVHNRASRKAGSFEAVRAEVSRWNKEMGGVWRTEEINDVTVYLNERYYKFPCPQSVCSKAQGATGRAPRG
jgi:cytochrome c2